MAGFARQLYIGVPVVTVGFRKPRQGQKDEISPKSVNIVATQMEILLAREAMWRKYCRNCHQYVQNRQTDEAESSDTSTSDQIR